jgi:hypothetical protein
MPALARRVPGLVLAERQVTVYEPIAAGQKRRSSAVRDGLEHAHRILAQLRSEQSCHGGRRDQRRGRRVSPRHWV